MSAANLKRITYGLARPEGRMVGTPGHDRAREMLVREMTALDLQPYAGHSFELPYKHQGQSFTNLAGVLPGRNRELEPVVIVGHYDSVLEGCCADDNAAAVAIGLEAIRQLRNSHRSAPLCFCCQTPRSRRTTTRAAMGACGSTRITWPSAVFMPRSSWI